MDPGLRRLNGLSRDEAEAELRTCCASRRWAAAMAVRRPFEDRAAVWEAAAKTMAGLGWDDIEEALRAHPRIGERIGGDAREASWSRREQAGVDGAGDDLKAALVEGNRAYEERFGHVFLICATGRSAAEMLAELRGRLANDPEAERAVVRDELAKITELRLAKLLGGG
ncbi:2-oxo-4-hydroxy-4-carboxy-5-ureidoimidazoline decarboxylase [Actinomadura miaoliensis]|uniref:2-oxo-4-hydroxy-4-carboxy-5-ureidoimidazoline decarboxylase n=1 Tax=Actinomadura miaoliensis TaxID=430685 RepID=A0ABP7WGJ2_9ACTN